VLSHSKFEALMVAGVVAAASLAGLAAPGAAAASSGSSGFLAPPPMGWSSWSSLREKISASVIEAQADVMHAQAGVVATALQDALVQDYDGVLRIAPAWPSGWDADATVYVQHRTKVDVQIPSSSAMPGPARRSKWSPRTPDAAASSSPRRAPTY
jgi:hypothetical protein